MSRLMFTIENRVRVVSALSPFFGWTGEVCSTHDGEFVTGVKHYRVMMDALPGAEQPLLFTEEALALAK